MSKKSHKNIVKALYVDAYISWNPTQQKYIIWTDKAILGKGELKNLAWIDAYENLKKEGRIL